MGCVRIFMTFGVLNLIAFTDAGDSWSEKDVTSCSPLHYISLPNGTIQAPSPGKLRFKCESGYFLGGPAQIRCRNGEWTSTKPPICLKAEGRCESPQKIANAQIFVGNLTYGSTVQYLCDPGYFILGDGNRICLRSGGWSGITPACLNETEPLEDVALRLEEKFITKVGAFSSDSIVQAKYLDTDSLLKGLEMVILVDRSSSVDPVDLEKGKDFIKFLFKKFKIKNGNNPDGARAAVLAFGDVVDVIFNLDDPDVLSPHTASEILDQKLQPDGGGTAMVPAFVDVYQKVVPFLRKDSKRALFLISDGDPNIGGTDVKALSTFLKDEANFEVFTVGIGRSINRTKLTDAASVPVIDHVFLLENYGNLKEIMWVIENKQPEVPPPPPEKCGHFDEENKVTRPWNALLYVSHPTKEKSATNLILCGGALICNQWVLTAAACFHYINDNMISVQLKEVFVVMGENNLLTPDPNEMNFYATDVVIHPRYNPQNGLFYNLALVKLNGPAPVNTFRPICLPYTDRLVPLHMKPDITSSLSAWGLSAPKPGTETISPTLTRQQAKMQNVFLADAIECKRLVGRRVKGKPIFCGSTVKESCLGNIGSPVVSKDPVSGIHHVLGILSQRKRCGKGFSQYTELTEFVPWINNVTDKCHFYHWNMN